MARAVLHVEGMPAVRRKLRALGDDLVDLKEANARAAAIVATAAAARAPKRTGRLAASIRGNRAVGRAEVKAGGARVPYAGPVHWGWPARGITAQPFAAEAAQQTEHVWLPAYAEDVARVVDKLNRS